MQCPQCWQYATECSNVLHMSDDRASRAELVQRARRFIQFAGRVPRTEHLSLAPDDAAWELLEQVLDADAIPLMESFDVERAARLAEVMTADPELTVAGMSPWTVQDVLSAALGRGLEAMEQQYQVRP
jgi:hypothetical protein